MKRKLSCLLAVTMLFSNVSSVYAADIGDTSLADSISETAAQTDEPAYAPSYTETSSPTDTTKEDTKNFIHIEYNTAEGQYKLTVKCDYTYTDQNTFKNDGVFAQIWSISALDGQNAVTGRVEIPETVDFEGKQITVVSIKQSAFERCGAESIILPSTIHEIQAKAFLNCPNLQYAEINSTFDPGRINEDGVAVDMTNLSNNTGNTLASVIGDNAFSGCTALESVTINGFAKLGNNIFDGCTALIDPYIAMDNTYVIKNSAYSTDKDGNNIYQTVTIGTYLFSGCTALKTYTFPEHINTVGGYTFNGCTSLETVSTGDYLKALAANAFTDCTSLKKINIGLAFTTAILYDFISSSTDFAGFTVDVNNTKFMAIDGALYEKKTGKVMNSEGETPAITYPITLHLYPPANTAEDFVLPGTVLNVSNKAFYGNKHIKNFKVETAPSYKKDGANIVSYINRVTMGTYVFYGATALENVEFVTDTAIGANDFEASSVKSFTADSIITIGKAAFKDCLQLGTIFHNVEPESFSNSSIGESVFSGCTNLKGELRVNDFNHIDARAFENCTGITSVILERTGTLGSYVFSGCTALENADISKMFDATPLGSGYRVRYGITAGTMGDYVFLGCTSLKKCIFTTRLFKISTGTFKNCTALTEVENVSPEDLYVIGKEAFYGCTSLVKAPYSRFLTRLDANAFYGCTNLEDIHLTKSAVIFNGTSNKGVFTGCDKLTIYAPQGSSAIKHAIANDIAYQYTDDDIRDEEYLVLDTAEDSDGNLVAAVVGYRGGFTSLTIPEDLEYQGVPVTMIGSNFMATSVSDCPIQAYVTDVTLTDIEEIGDKAFSGCKALAEVTFDDCLETIGNSAFLNCTSLGKTQEIEDENGEITTKTIPIVIPSSLKTIGNSAFESSGVEEVTFPEDSSVQIGNKAFYNCRNLTKLEAFGSKDIGISAFENCTSLEEVRFSPAVENVHKYAFRGCTSLESVTIQSGMFLDDYAFANCTNLERIVVSPTSNAAFSSSAFQNSSPDAYIVCKEGSPGYYYASESNIDTEIADFLDPTETAGYVVIKGQLSLPDDIVNVTRNGQALMSGDYIYGGEKLDIDLNDNLDESLQYNLFINGELIEELPVTYTVKENENVDITIVTGQKLPVTAPDVIIITRSGKQVRNDGYVLAGDVLTITADTENYSVTNVMCNGKKIALGKTYTVTDTDTGVVITADVRAYGKLTFPEEITVKKGSTVLTSPYKLTGGARETFAITVPDPEEGTANIIYINGEIFVAGGNTATFIVQKNVTTDMESYDISYKAISNNFANVKKVLRHAAGIENLSDEEIETANVNQDQTVDILDAVVITQTIK